MNEAETRADLIDPALRLAGWGEVAGSRVRREYTITLGRIQETGKRAKSLSADYVLVYRGKKLAVVEAKSRDKYYTEGVGQAKHYAKLLEVRFAYATNGEQIYFIDMVASAEGEVAHYLGPDKLWEMTFSQENEWRTRFGEVEPNDKGGSHPGRYYQELAVDRVLEAVAAARQRILLTLATGTGKTFIAFQIAWKLHQSRWNLTRTPQRRPRILFLADRNVLADQAFNAFSAFDNARIRIRPEEIGSKGKVPTNGQIFFTIFQTFMSGPPSANGEPSPYFGQYPPDFFDLIIIDECHRGGANDESSWHAILNYFQPAVHLGLTATPKREDNVDTYAYFGEPVYIYSLKEGINHGFLTPFRLKQITTSLDEYTYTPDDTVLEGEVDTGRTYTEPDFNRRIEIKAREEQRVKILLDEIDPDEKTLVFCATQAHASLVRDLINQHKRNPSPHYCERVTANDGALGEQHLRDFQDNEKTVPTILTTSQKLSTGVDARNVRNIALLRPVNSMIEFKQIIGRGTRLYDGKTYFTIYDFVGAHAHFQDPEWDGEPLAPEPPKARHDAPRTQTPAGDDEDQPKAERLRIQLADGKTRELSHQIQTTFWNPNGPPMTAQQFMESLFGKLPEFFKDEAELRDLWSAPDTRAQLLRGLDAQGFKEAQLVQLQALIGAEKSDLFDVLAYVAYALPPVARDVRAANAQARIGAQVDEKQRGFVEFVLAHYVRGGVSELASEKLRDLIALKYKTIKDAGLVLGSSQTIRQLFVTVQKFLYERQAA